MSGAPENPGWLAEMAFQPLRWSDADPVMASLTGGSVTADNLLNFLRGPFAQTSLDELRARYLEISEFDGSLIAVPSHPRLYNGIVVPLHNAKAAYVLGHYVSCIALAGVVCEMIALFRFEIASIKCGTGLLDTEKQKLLWGRPFESLGQKDRIGALEALGLVDQETVKALVEMQGVRRKYMHLLTDHRNQEAADARKAYSLAIAVSATVAGATLQSGSFGLHFHPDLVRWLHEKGMMKPYSASEGKDANIEPITGS